MAKKTKVNLRPAEPVKPAANLQEPWKTEKYVILYQAISRVTLVEGKAVSSTNGLQGEKAGTS